MLVFSKEKMIERIKKEGRENLIDQESLKIMDNLNLQPVSRACWRRQVFDEPVLSCIGKDGKDYLVNENDVIWLGKGE